MISPFGLCIRRIRGNETLKAMATKLGVSSPFLSAMEVGRKVIPVEYADKIAKIYSLSEEEYNDLYHSIISTNERVNIELSQMTEAQKEVSITFARRIENADPDLVEKLRKVLEED